MSARPIPRADRVHAASQFPNRAYCGAQNPRVAGSWKDVTCVNCASAYRADQEARG